MINQLCKIIFINIVHAKDCVCTCSLKNNIIIECFRNIIIECFTIKIQKLNKVNIKWLFVILVYFSVMIVYKLHLHQIFHSFPHLKIHVNITFVRHIPLVQISPFFCPNNDDISLQFILFSFIITFWCGWCTRVHV